VASADTMMDKKLLFTIAALVATLSIIAVMGVVGIAGPVLAQNTAGAGDTSNMTTFEQNMTAGGGNMTGGISNSTSTP
jgi:hypothetical protein